MTYFGIIPKELTELVISKVKYQDEDNFIRIYSDYNRLNVFRLKYPYLAKISKLKVYNKLYDSLANHGRLHEYFVSGTVTSNLKFFLYEALDALKINIDAVIPILSDVYSKLYPQSSDIHIPSLYLIDTNTMLVEMLTAKHDHISFIEMDFIETDLNTLKSHHEIDESTICLILEIVLNKCQRESVFIDPDGQNWIRNYIKKNVI